MSVWLSQELWRLGVKTDSDVNGSFLFPPGTESSHSCWYFSNTEAQVDQEELRVHEWARPECQPDFGWFRKPLESTHYLMTRSLKQCKIFQIQLHIKCSSTDLVPQRRSFFHISLIKVYFHNAREVSPQTLQSLRFYSKDFKKAYKYQVMIKNSVGFLKNLNYLKLWKW